jgi:hypothetical protein
MGVVERELWGRVGGWAVLPRQLIFAKQTKRCVMGERWAGVPAGLPRQWLFILTYECQN